MHAVLIALLLLLLAAAPAQAAIGFVTATAAQGTSTTAIDTTGATAMFMCTTTVSSTATVTDSKGNTWVRDVGPLAINDAISLWRASTNIVGTAHTFSIATNGNGHDTLLVGAFSGLPSAVLERTANQLQNGLGSGATISSSNTATTAVADQVVLGCSQLSNSAAFAWTATGGATLAASLGNGNTDSTGALSYKIVSTTGVQAATFTATAAGNAITAVATYRAGVVDTTPPTVPQGCNATATGSFSASVACSPSSDNIGVCSYTERRCAAPACVPSVVVGNPSIPTVTDTGLAASTLYRWTLEAIDCSGNPSGQSAIVEATTQPVTECNFSWTAPVGGTAPDLYTIRRCDTTAASCPPSVQLTTKTPPTTTVKDLACPQPVACFDVNASAAGSGSAFTTAVCVTSAAGTIPVLSVSPPSLIFAATVGGANPPSRTLTVTNSTVSTMNWSAAKDQAWISSLVPSSGTNTTPVTVNVSIATLTAGTYQANITVTAAGATNSPVTIPVTLNLSPAVTSPSGQGGRVK